MKHVFFLISCHLADLIEFTSIIEFKNVTNYKKKANKKVLFKNGKKNALNSFKVLEANEFFLLTQNKISHTHNYLNTQLKKKKLKNTYAYANKMVINLKKKIKKNISIKSILMKGNDGNDLSFSYL